MSGPTADQIGQSLDKLSLQEDATETSSGIEETKKIQRLLTDLQLKEARPKRKAVKVCVINLFHSSLSFIRIALLAQQIS